MDSMRTLFQSEDEMNEYDDETKQVTYRDEGVFDVTAEEKNMDKVVNLKEVAKNKNATIEVFYPRVFSEAERMGKVLLDGKAVILNFTRMDEEEARRFIDYLAGVVYAIEGDMQKIANQVFVAVPRYFTVAGEIDSEDNYERMNRWQRKDD